MEIRLPFVRYVKQFQKSLLLIGQKNFFWPISEEKQPGDSRVSLHDVVFLFDRHSGQARSSAKVSEQNVHNLEKLQPLARLQETNTLR